MNRTSLSAAGPRFRRGRPLFLAIVLLLAVPLGRSIGREEAPQPRQRDVMVAMRDGVPLATTIYVPAEGDGPWPTILVRTPYNKNGVAGMGGQAARRGYALAAQDTRGRFASEGDYVVFASAREDGYDAVQWCAEQAWCDGNVGMWGGSAVGITANMAAAAAPPALRCAYVVVAPTSWREESLYMGGVWRKEMIDGWMAGQGATAVRKRWEKLPILDPYWDPYEIHDAHEAIGIPIYNVAGWFDIFLKGGIANFAGLQAHGAGLARGNQKLLIAPIGHGALTAGIQFPPSAGRMPADDLWRWFDHWLKGVDNGIEREPAVRYYLMGDCRDAEAPGNRWMTTDVWPPPVRPVFFYLHGDATLRRDLPRAARASTSYRYDPRDPVPTVGGANLVYAQKGPADQSVIQGREDYLRFQTEPLAEPITVVGPIRVELFVSTDAPDTDFMAKLVDVYPDGYEALLQDSAMRVRYREWYDVEPMMEPGEVAILRLDLWSTANVFNAGHRIAVHVTSSNDPRFDPNPNTGEPLRANDRTRVALNTVFHDAYRPSRLILPVLDPPADAPAPMAGD